MKKLYNFAENILFIVMWISLICNIGIREKFDKGEAAHILMDTYAPLEQFYRDSAPTENPLQRRVPENIKNKQNFINLFEHRICDRVATNFYEDLVLEQNGKLYLDATKYFPSIDFYKGKVTRAYIRKKFFLHFPPKITVEEHLIIKESFRIFTTGVHRRRNEYIKNSEGTWELQSYSGTGMCGSGIVENNPWYCENFEAETEEITAVA